MTRITFLKIATVLTLGSAVPCWGAESADIDRQLRKCEETGEELCFKKMETSAISSQKAIVSRKGTNLTIQTKIKNVYFQNKSGADAHATEYRYIGFLDKIKYHVVVRRAWENRDFILISDASGGETQMSAVPYLSPSLKQMISVSASEGYDPNEITIWAITPDRLKRLYHYAPAEYALYKFLAWEDETTIRLENFTRSNGKYCPKGKLMTITESLKLEKEKWQLSIDTPVAAKCQ